MPVLCSNEKATYMYYAQINAKHTKLNILCLFLAEIRNYVSSCAQLHLQIDQAFSIFLA